MRQIATPILLLCLTSHLWSCGDGDGSGADAAGEADSGAPADAAADAHVVADVATPAVNATAVPRPGFGDISGACAVLDDEEWLGDAPVLFRNQIDFGSHGYTDDDLALLTTGGQEIVADGNAGGSSLMSEVFAFEMLHRCELAELRKTETEIAYVNAGGKMTDLLVELDERKIGVSVTRAVGYPRDDPYTVGQATDLLEGKLADVLASTANVAEEDAWSRQILHVVAYAAGHAESIATAFAAIDDAVRADTIVIVTVTDGDDEFLY